MSTLPRWLGTLPPSQMLDRARTARASARFRRLHKSISTLPERRLAARIDLDSAWQSAKAAKRVALTSRNAMRCASYALSVAAALMLSGCDTFMIYHPTSKYDGHVVRGDISSLSTKEIMGENWDKKSQGVPDAPSREDYVNNYRRAVVRSDRTISGGLFIYPFVPNGLDVAVGDIVDVDIPPGRATGFSFNSRLVVTRLVCKRTDKACLESEEGRKRGIVDVLPPQVAR
jgi:hypothetical protein